VAVTQLDVHRRSPRAATTTERIRCRCDDSLSGLHSRTRPPPPPLQRPEIDRTIAGVPLTYGRRADSARRAVQYSARRLTVPSARPLCHSRPGSSLVAAGQECVSGRPATDIPRSLVTNRCIMMIRVTVRHGTGLFVAARVS